MTVTAPQTPIGYVSDSYTGAGNWWSFDPNETTPELQWPQSVFVFDQMRKQDAQVGSVLEAVCRPVLRTPWRIDPAGARDEVVEFVAEDLGLPIVGENPEPPARTKDRFSWTEHLELALLMLPFGHSYFEVVYRVTDDGSKAHLGKLELRPARTIQQIDVARDGGLISITQYQLYGTVQKPITVDRLVAYIYKKEGANWLGRSILRQAYKNWLIKDRLLRVQAQTIERNGMGIPLYKAAEDGSPSDLAAGLAMAKAWRAGEAAGSAVPFGADLILRGVEGQLPDALPAVKYHDEQIARAVLAHFLNLDNQSHGSYALGTSFMDFFTLSLQTLAQSVADVASMHIVEDLVDVNWGPEEPAPRIVFDEIGSRQAATAASVKTLVDAGIITPDERLEESSRQQYGLPPAEPETARDPKAPTPSGGSITLPSLPPSTPTERVEARAPYPGQRYKHGWIPIAAALVGQAALDAAPATYRSGPNAHFGDYEGATYDVPAGGGLESALAEYEGVEYINTNNYLRHGPLASRDVVGREPTGDELERIREMDAEDEARIAEIDKTMAVSKLTAPVQVDRVIQNGQAVFGMDVWNGGVIDWHGTFEEQDAGYERWLAGDRPDLTGASWPERGYTSTTANPEYAEAFGARWASMAKETRDSQGEPVIMTITVPAGVGAIQLGDMGTTTGPGGRTLINSAELMLERGLVFTVVADHGIDEKGFRRLDVEARRAG